MENKKLLCSLEPLDLSFYQSIFFPKVDQLSLIEGGIYPYRPGI